MMRRTFTFKLYPATNNKLYNERDSVFDIGKNICSYVIYNCPLHIYSIKEKYGKV